MADYKNELDALKKQIAGIQTLIRPKNVKDTVFNTLNFAKTYLLPKSVVFHNKKRKNEGIKFMKEFYWAINKSSQSIEMSKRLFTRAIEDKGDMAGTKRTIKIYENMLEGVRIHTHNRSIYRFVMAKHKKTMLNNINAKTKRDLFKFYIKKNDKGDLMLNIKELFNPKEWQKNLPAARRPLSVAKFNKAYPRINLIGKKLLNNQFNIRPKKTNPSQPDLYVKVGNINQKSYYKQPYFRSDITKIRNTIADIAGEYYDFFMRHYFGKSTTDIAQKNIISNFNLYLKNKYKNGA